MKYPFNKTVYNCKQATLLSLKREEGKATLFELIKLEYHLFFCDPCKRFISQNSLLKEKSHLTSEQLLTDAARTRMQDIIDRENR